MITGALRWRRHAAAAAASVLAGTAMAAVFPPVNLGAPFVFVCLVPFLLLLRRCESPLEAAACGFCFGLGAFGTGMWWLKHVLWWIGLGILVPFVAIFTMLFAVFHHCFRRLERGTSTVPAAYMLAVSAAWCGVEFMRGEVGPLSNGTLSLGYAAFQGPLLMTASVIGVYGTSFLFCLTNLCWTLALESWTQLGRGEIRNAARRWACPALALLLPGLGCLWGLHLEHETLRRMPHGWLHVVAVQAERAPLERYMELSSKGLGERRPARGLATLVAWPEKTVEGFVEEEPATLKKLGSFCRAHGVWLLFGSSRRIPPDEQVPLSSTLLYRRYYNCAFLMDPRGRIAGCQYKTKPVPFIGDGCPAPGLQLPVLAGVRLGIPTCYDADFSLVERAVAAAGAECLLIPTRDNKWWGWTQHVQRALMARLRAVECGLYLARISTSGPTCLISPTGKYLAGIFSTDEGWSTFRLPLMKSDTLYVRGGWLFAPLCLAASLLLALVFTLRRGGEKSGQVLRMNSEE